MARKNYVVWWKLTYQDGSVSMAHAFDLAKRKAEADTQGKTFEYEPYKWGTYQQVIDAL